jgi:hypothetical protein
LLLLVEDIIVAIIIQAIVVFQRRGAIEILIVILAIVATRTTLSLSLARRAPARGLLAEPLAHSWRWPRRRRNLVMTQRDQRVRRQHR